MEPDQIQPRKFLHEQVFPEPGQTTVVASLADTVIQCARRIPNAGRH